MWFARVARNRIAAYGHDISEDDIQDIASHAIMRVTIALKRSYNQSKGGWKTYCRTIIHNDISDEMAKQAKWSMCDSIEANEIDVEQASVDIEQVAIDMIGDPVLLELALSRIRGEHTAKVRARLHLTVDEYNNAMERLRDALTAGKEEA